MRAPDSRGFWDDAARGDAYWHIATGSSGDPAEFYASGAAETDALLADCGIVPSEGRAVLEIGCGAGRMTWRLSELFGQVIALDVSAEMLRHARRALAGRGNITFLHGNGSDLSGLADQSVDVVFSYITMQHVPTGAGQLSYVRETARVLRPGGQAALQFRANGVLPVALDLAGHVAHAVQGRRTFRREWRGARVPAGELLAAARGRGAAARLVRRGARHLWLLITAPTP
ncbi:MAG TPA: class I SAM-dependent methyltransferase [Mycobacteriales bacterium]|nr:class I SAM-dependent methyltransferase [Mycobacteriales bacterium]